MRIKIAVLLLSLMFAYSCKKNENQSNSTSEKKVESTTEKIEQKKVEQKIETNHAENFDKFLTTLDKKDISSISKAFSYFNEKLKGADAKISDNCFAKLNKFIDEILVAENERFEKTEDDDQQIIYESTLKEETEYSKKATQKHKDYLKNLKDNFLFVDADMGSYFIGKDRDLILKKVENSISPTMKIFLTQNAKENKKPYWVDAGLTITPKQLAEGVIFWESFIKENSGFPMITEGFLLELQTKSSILFRGVDHSPVFNYETETISDNFKEAYLFVVEKHPDTKIGKLVKSYYEILKKTGFKESDESIKFLDNLSKK